MRRLDAMAADGDAPATAKRWTEPSAGELRAAQREADRILQRVVRMPPKPDTLTTRLDAVLLHPVAGLVILLALLFVMFQAVFTWAQPLMDLISLGFDGARRRWSIRCCRPACCRASSRTA